ncbi:MAG: tyrosine-type recombinase/integrase [Verrucomicrobia bacterium]|nr:tyrosine-type recombinase/integrase [Verrucomicrobiota bacterium]
MILATLSFKAAEIYSFIQANGWAAALERHKPAASTCSDTATVGTFIAAACRISSARRQSLDAYTKAFRLIVSEIREITSERKHDFHGGGVAEWRNQIDAVPLETITPAEIVAWKNRRLREAETDPLAERRAIVTVNSLIRNAKALFGKKILPFIDQSVTVPRLLPFEGVAMEKPPSMRYVSKIDPYAILARAKEELAESDPESFKVIVLALVCGLRRSEIDNLLWRAFDFSRSLLRVESTEYHRLKSEDSAGEIDLDADALALFRGYRAKAATTTFVIESPNPPPNRMQARGYRCDGVFVRVLAWLRAQGVDSAKPLHTMRKEIGSVIASEHGIYVASRYLRHSDIRITSAIYADKKKVITPQTFAGLLAAAPAARTVDFKQPAAVTTDANQCTRKGNG